MSMTDNEFKNEVMRRGEIRRAKYKRNRKIVLSIVPAVVLTAVLVGAVSFMDFGNIIASNNRSAEFEAEDYIADEDAEGSYTYATTDSTNALIAITDDASGNGAAAQRRATVTVKRAESVSHMLGEKQVKEITDTVNRLINYNSNLITDDKATQYEESVQPDYTVTLTNAEGAQSTYYIIKNTFTDDKKVILCDDEQKVKELIELIN